MDADVKHCGYKDCRALATHQAGPGYYYCRDHYVVVNRRVNSYDQRVFHLMNINTTLVDPPHDGAVIRLSLSRSDNSYIMAFCHEIPTIGPNDEQELTKRTLTIQSLSDNDLQNISRTLRAMADDIDRRTRGE